jgi:hypothetical protein
MQHQYVMLLVILLYLIVLFVLEVRLGSSTGVYNAEIGYEVNFDQAAKLSQKQFFIQLLPVSLLCNGGIYYLFEKTELFAF